GKFPRARAMRNSKTRSEIGPMVSSCCVKHVSTLTMCCTSVCVERVKWLAFVWLIPAFLAATSCTTLVNRRDLYSPEPAPESLEAARQWYGGTTIQTTTIRTQRASGASAAPDFRY